MKAIITLFFAMCSCCVWAQVKQTLHRTFVADEATQLQLNLGSSNIEIRESKGSRVVVEITVAADVPNEAMMNFLVEQKRYELEQEMNVQSGTLTLSSKKNLNVLMVKGKECKEELSYIVFLPAKIKHAGVESTSKN